MRNILWLLVIAVAFGVQVQAADEPEGGPAVGTVRGRMATAAREAAAKHKTNLEEQIKALEEKKAALAKKLHDARDKVGILADPAVVEFGEALKKAENAYKGKVAELKAADPNAGEAVLKDKRVVELAAAYKKAQKAYDDKLTELSMKNEATRDLCLEAMKLDETLDGAHRQLENLSRIDRDK